MASRPADTGIAADVLSVLVGAGAGPRRRETPDPPPPEPTPRHDDARAAARAGLVRILQDAHAGELAAAWAYRGHWRSRRDPAERREIRRIEEAEWHHRSLVAGLLDEMGEGPRRRRELAMGMIGRVFGALCFVSLRFAPMYAAGRLEAMNVGQYATARDHALTLGLGTFRSSLEAMRQEELRHEDWFADQVRGHWLLPLAAKVGGWAPADPTEPSHVR